MEKEKHPVVTIRVTGYGTVQVELYPEAAPNTVNNFISLVKKGFYNGLTFHRVIPGFMIQGGDPEGNGTGGPGYSIPGEFERNGFSNPLSHTDGVISMARAMDPNSAGSQFFLMHGNGGTFLDGQYAAFGKTVSGFEVIDAIANCPVRNPGSQSPKPIQDVVMESVTVDTDGADYPEPQKLFR